MQLHSRLTYAMQFVVISGLLLFSLYLQFYQGVLPCPLCSLQRVAFMFLAISALIMCVLFRYRAVRLLTNTFSVISAILGIILAGRQIWLQHFPPPTSAECSPSLQYMIHVLPMNELIQKIFSGSAECVDRSWEFMSIGMAEWALVWFIFLGLLSYCQLRHDLVKRRYVNNIRH